MKNVKLRNNIIELMMVFIQRQRLKISLIEFTQNIRIFHQH